MNISNKNEHKGSVLDIIVALAAFILLMPSAFRIFGNYRSQIVHIVSLLCIILISLRVKMRYSSFIYILILFELEFVFSALLNGTQFMEFIYIALPIVSICVLSYYGIRHFQKDYLTILIYVLTFYSTIHLINRVSGQILGYDTFGNTLFFLGSDNQATSFLMCLFILCVLRIMTYGVDVISVYGVIIPVFIAFYSKCGTAMTVYAVIGLFALLSSLPIVNKAIYKLSSHKVFFITYIILSLLLLIIPSLFTSGSIGNWITRLTGKNSITFSSRTYVWLAALLVFAKNPVFGIGYGTEGNGVYALGNYRGAHNQVLQWAVLGGTVSVIIFLIQLYIALKKTSTYPIKNRFYVLLSIFGYLLCMSMENYFNGIHIILLLCVIYHYSFPNDKELAVLKRGRIKWKIRK